MGACCSYDYLPPVPDKVQDDPDEQEEIEATIIMFGMIGSRDYGVYKGVDPPQDKVQDCWMWMNKGDTEQRGVAIVELENFKRSDEENKDKGEVLTRIELREKPEFALHTYYSSAGQPVFRFLGFFSDNYKDPEDDHFRHHPSIYKSDEGKQLGKTIMTKWKFNSQCRILPVAGRGEKYGDQEMILHVFGKGTGCTYFTEEWRDVTNAEGETHKEKHTEKHEGEFVDRLEFRVTRGDTELAIWFQDGDFAYNAFSQDHVIVNTPLFDARVQGGLLKRSSVIINTHNSEAVDPALALTIGHVVMTEFTPAEVKSDLRLGTPGSPVYHG